jgi:hypothetical protein
MKNVITLGRKLVPVEQIALVEPFDAATNPDFKPEKPYKARVLLLNRTVVLTEATPQDFAHQQGFRVLAEDNVATNPTVAFRVEKFEPTETFKPTRPYLTRLMWRDEDGNEQSKLLLTKPEAVIAVALRGETEAGADRKEPVRRAKRATRVTLRRAVAPEG